MEQLLQIMYQYIIKYDVWSLIFRDSWYIVMLAGQMIFEDLLHSVIIPYTIVLHIYGDMPIYSFNNNKLDYFQQVMSIEVVAISANFFFNFLISF